MKQKTNDKNKEVKMRFREKMAILMVATLISFVVFSLIAAPAVDIVKVGKDAGYEIISNVLAKKAVNTHQSSNMTG